MKIFSMFYFAACLLVQSLAFFGYLPKFFFALSLPLGFALQGIWVLYALKASGDDTKRKQIFFWWAVGFLPVALLPLLSSGISEPETNTVYNFAVAIFGLLFLVAIVRIIWIGSAAMTAAEREKFQKAKTHPFLTGLCFFYLIPGLFFLDRRIKALRD